MTDRIAPTARRPSLARAVGTIAAVAATAAALVWSALFYGATHRQSATATPQAAPAGGSTQPAPAPAPVTTRTS